MKNIVVNKLIISFMCCSLLFVGCGKEEEPEVHTISEMSEDTKDEDDTWYKMEDGSFMVVPNMFIQDYEDVKISKKYTVAEKGQLITCLSMIDSFWNGKTVTPDKFIKEYKSYIKSDGSCDIDAISEEIMKDDSMTYEKMDFDAMIMSEKISKNQAVVLLEICHNSIYGKGKSYMIITGIAEEGYACVRDPNKWNNDNLASQYKTDMDETLYPLTEVLASAGNDSTMYIYRWRD